MTPHSGDIIHSWIKQYQPEAIVTSIKNILPIMNKLGWKIPEDIGVACLSKPASNPVGDLAVILEDSVHLGAVAVDLVINMIRRREKTPPTTPIQIIVEGKWHPGKTLRKLHSGL
jgi:DNA-binding LacI/PurR family transcriptional regulator